MNEPFKRDEKGRLLPGHKGGPGRPKGKTLKEFARDYLMGLPDEKKTEFLNTLSKDIVWRMAEGNPSNSTDITTGGEPLPLFDYTRVRINDGNKKNTKADEEN